MSLSDIVLKNKKKADFKVSNKKVVSSLKEFLSNNEDSLFLTQNYNTINDIENIKNRIDNCSSNVVIQSNGNDFRTLEQNACNVSCLCHVCASAKRKKVINSIMPYIDCIKDMNGLYVYMVTATIPNSETPGHDYKIIRRFWTNFTKRGQRRGSKMDVGEASKIVGGVFSFETIQASNSDSIFNSHCHILLITSDKIDYRLYKDDDDTKSALKKLYFKYGYGKVPKELLEPYYKNVIDFNGSKVPMSKFSMEWYLSSYKTSINIDIEPLYEGKIIKDNQGKKLQSGSRMSLRKQIYEIIKYETKPFELSDNPSSIIKVWDSVQGKRRITKFGILTNRKKDLWESLLKQYGLKERFESLTKDLRVFPKKFEDVQNYSFKQENKFENPEYKNTSRFYKFNDEFEQRSFRRIVIQSVHRYNSKVHELKNMIKDGLITAKEYIESKLSAKELLKAQSIVLGKIHRDYLFVVRLIKNELLGTQLDLFEDKTKKIIEKHIESFKFRNKELLVV